MIDYYAAAEDEIRRLPKLKKALEILNARIQTNDTDSGTDSKGYYDRKKISKRISCKIGKHEIEREIKNVEDEIKNIESALAEIEDTRRKVIEMAYIDGLSGEKIAEKIYCQSAKTVYQIRNRGIEDFALLFFGR